jgi:hypothetical protein
MNEILVGRQYRSVMKLLSVVLTWTWDELRNFGQVTTFLSFFPYW